MAHPYHGRGPCSEFGEIIGMCGISSNPAGDFRGTVKRVTRITPKIFSMEIECPPLSRAARPGQFVMIRIGGVTDPLLGRPLAVYFRNGDSFSVCFQVVGRMTVLLSEALPGTVLSVRGPVGNGFGNPPSKVTMVAGALGVAPLLFAYTENQVGTEKDFILGIADGEWIPFCEWIGKIVPDVRIFSEDGSIGTKGNVLSGLSVPMQEGSEIWACGPIPMLRAISGKFPSDGERIKVSLETRMACGMGGCLGCSINTIHGKKRVCVDGPVFSAKEVCWDDLRG